MHRFERCTINGLNLKNFRASWKALKESVKKAKSGFSGKQRSPGESKIGKPKLRTKFLTRGLLGKVSTRGPNSETITFDKISADGTRVNATIGYEPEGLLEKTGDALGIPSGRIEGDLKN
jgi:hypothetical protein